ncbi:SDR family NAD(P)-dependent oxidoreductase [Thiomicrospira sp. ALE5]|uniref:SDR family NAD(P)-dependent oxidoreductase n=1 Tax=Thiomicrospira sp. ALE5 TaxID=748650 RepID=UPI0008E1C28B|nr:SDR family NAD(P)-dependent oxidoreductase [Thiomicrospira sp. ALE5]SFR49786.1 NAD(P)-dependent dehydrogenase, short-chain alcohol dehydrogenase family [Thiomicrospira sp. ALE5]
MNDISTQKTFLITGAAHGLGQALAKALHQQNHQLILIDKELKALNQLYDELAADNWGNVYLFPMDLAGSAQDEFMQLESGLAEFKQLDGVFLNAGILPALTPIEHFDPLQWYEVMQTNLNANFHLIQSCLPKLTAGHDKDNQAWLVAISDQAVQKPNAYYGAYAVAKAGLEQLIKLTAIENPAIKAIIAQLPPLAGHFRSKLFPGEPPCQNETVESAAERIVNACFKQQKQDDIAIY